MEKKYGVSWNLDAPGMDDSLKPEVHRTEIAEVLLHLSQFRLCVYSSGMSHGHVYDGLCCRAIFAGMHARSYARLHRFDAEGGACVQRQAGGVYGPELQLERPSMCVRSAFHVLRG